MKSKIDQTEINSKLTIGNLYYHTNEPTLIVMCIKNLSDNKFAGVVLHYKGENYAIGEYYDNYNKSYFRLFKDKLTLEND